MSKRLKRPNDKWEARLYDENLSPITDSDRFGVSNRHAGKIKDAAQALNRKAGEADMERRQYLLRVYSFATKKDRAIFKMYADGVGTIAIAKALKLSQRYTRNLVAKVKAYKAPKRSIRYLVKQSDPTVLTELLIALTKMKAR